MMRVPFSSGDGSQPVRTRRPSASGPLRCLVVVGSLGRGGAERQAILTAAALRDLGHDATLHVIGPPVALLEDAKRLSVRVDVPARRTVPPLQIARLRRAIVDQEPDAVVTFLASASLRLLLARLLGKEACRPVWIVTERGHLRMREALRNPIRSALRAWCFHAADRVALNSSALAANAIGFVGALALKAEVVPNVLVPFDVDATHARAEVRRLLGREGVPIVGAVGSFQADRNHDLLAQALPLVLRAHPQAQVLVVGRTTGPGCVDSAQRFRQHIARLGLEGHVTLAGEVAAARALIPGFDAFVLTSSLEGSSNALTEALVAGAAIATTPVADAEAVLAGAGVVSSGWTPEALARAVLEALERRDELRLRSGARGRELLAEREPCRIGQAWARLIEEAMEARTRRGGPGQRPERTVP
jgi:glycosyltransferase involved in cell wall biosynthesis